MKYDIIIIGTGMGGGVIAGDLFDTNSRVGKNAKSVLVIEKGGLAFHSHCLNAARPSGYGEDRGQQNDTFFALFKENYTFKDPEQSKEWKGGPMFNIGGRGAAWGLFCPRIHDDLLDAKFGKQLCKELRDTWYTEAETLMSLSLPLTNTIHQSIMERMNIKTKEKGCQWQWGRIASEFSESKNFDFALGAYSPIDKLLEIAMSKARDPDTGVNIEHPNWKIIINTEVREILWDDAKRATGVVVKDAKGNEFKIYLNTEKGSTTPLSDTKIVLAAGSVGSPAILMRSGMKDELQKPDSNALHLTDHDIFAKGVTFTYNDPSVREKVGSMKLQSYIKLQSGKIALINFAIDSSSFLPREFLPTHHFTNKNFPKLIAAIILPAELNKANTIDLDDDGEPVLTAKREFPFENSRPEIEEIRDVTKKALIAVKDVLKLQFLPVDVGAEDEYDWNDKNFFKELELGGVAHELGTLPLQCYDHLNDNFIVKPNLELKSYKGVFVCDLSVFPFSPEVNPTPTLVALALRLSRDTLLPRIPFTAARSDVVYIMNQSGENVKVFVSNLTGATLSPEEIADNKEGGKVLEPGDFISRDRSNEQQPIESRPVAESVLVYTLQYNSDKLYLKKPETLVATLGVICIID